MSIRWARLLLLIAGLQACRAASPPAPKSEPSPPPLARAPEAPAPRVKVLEKDSEGCTWVESEGTVTVGENESLHQARAAAVSEARIAAMQDFLGVEVRSRFMDFQQEGLRDQTSLTENILQTTRLGRILKEKIVEKGRKDLAGCEGCRYYVRLQTCLVPVAASADKEFQVELGISRSRFEEGDEAKLTVTATRDCFVYLYDVGMNWETSLLVPNDLVPSASLAAGKTWEYPDEAAKRNGVRLIAQLPQGNPPVSAETIRVIATRVPLSVKMMDPGGSDFLGVLRRLNASRTDWSEDAQAFTIYKR